MQRHPRPAELAPLALAALLCAHVAAAAPATEEAGLIVFEAESSDTGEGWTTVADTEATGGLYLRWDGPSRAAGSQAGDGLTRYLFTLERAGRFELRWRNRIDLGDDSTEHNDSWARFPSGQNIVDELPLNGWTKVYMNRLGRFHWDTNTVDFDPQPIRQHFEAGTHALEIAGRSPGHAIDRIVLYRYEEVSFDTGAFDTAAPTGDGRDDGTTDGGATDGATDGGTAGDGTAGDDTAGDATTGGESGGGTAGGDTAGDATTGGESGGGTTDGGQTWSGLDEHVPGTCADGRLVVSPVDDVHVADGQTVDGATLHIDGVSRAGWLRFDLRGLGPAAASAATLHLQVADEGGSGALSAWLAAHADWDGATDPAALPEAMVWLGARTGALLAGERVDLPLDAASLPTGETLTLWLTMDSGDDDIAFASSEATEGGLRLALQGGAALCESWEASASEREDDGVVEPPSGPDVEEPAVPTVEPPSVEPAPMTLGVEPEATGPRTEAGALGPPAALLLALAALASRRRRA